MIFPKQDLFSPQNRNSSILQQFMQFKLKTKRQSLAKGGLWSEVGRAERQDSVVAIHLCGDRLVLLNQPRRMTADQPGDRRISTDIGNTGPHNTCNSRIRHPLSVGRCNSV